MSMKKYIETLAAWLLAVPLFAADPYIQIKLDMQQQLGQNKFNIACHQGETQNIRAYLYLNGVAWQPTTNYGGVFGYGFDREDSTNMVMRTGTINTGTNYIEFSMSETDLNTNGNFFAQVMITNNTGSTWIFNDGTIKIQKNPLGGGNTAPTLYSVINWALCTFLGTTNGSLVAGSNVTFRSQGDRGQYAIDVDDPTSEYAEYSNYASNLVGVVKDDIITNGATASLGLFGPTGTESNQFVNRDQLYDVVSAYSTRTLYGMTNEHDVASGGTLWDSTDGAWTNTLVTAEGTNKVGSFIYTNTVAGARAGNYIGRYYTYKSGLATITAYMELIAVSEDGGTTNVLATSGQSGQIGTSITSYRIVAALAESYTNDAYIGVNYYVIKTGAQPTTVYTLGGGSYASHVETPGLSLDTGYVHQDDYDSYTNTATGATNNLQSQISTNYGTLLGITNAHAQLGASQAHGGLVANTGGVYEATATWDFICNTINYLRMTSTETVIGGGQNTITINGSGATLGGLGATLSWIGNGFELTNLFYLSELATNALTVHMSNSFLSVSTQYYPSNNPASYVDASVTNEHAQLGAADAHGGVVATSSVWQISNAGTQNQVLVIGSVDTNAPTWTNSLKLANLQVTNITGVTSVSGNGAGWTNLQTFVARDTTLLGSTPDFTNDVGLVTDGLVRELDLSTYITGACSMVQFYFLGQLANTNSYAKIYAVSNSACKYALPIRIKDGNPTDTTGFLPCPSNKKFYFQASSNAWIRLELYVLGGLK